MIDSGLKWRASLAAIFVLAAPLVVFSKTFTSIAKMKTLPQMERGLITALQEYLSHSARTPSDPLNTFAQKADAECRQAEDDDEYMHNPLNSYHVLLRLVKHWDDVIVSIRCDHCADEHPAAVFSEVEEATRKLPFWPEDGDLAGSVVAIARLAYIYRLKLSDVSRGRIKETITSPLTSRELVMMGDELSNDPSYQYDAVRFYKQALDTINIGLGDDWTRLVDDIAGRKHTELKAYKIYKKISSLYYHYGAISLALQTLNEASVRLDPTPEESKRLKNDLAYYAQVKAETTQEPVFKRRSQNFLDKRLWKTYARLCRDPPRRLSSSRVYCEFWETHNPLYRAKAEYVHREPDLIVFHDFIHDGEMDWLKRESFKLLERSRGMTDDEEMFAKTRISESAWHNDVDVKELRRISHRIHLITGMDVNVTAVSSPSEQMQALNYGLGGMYEPHLDCYYHDRGPDTSPMMATAGDRIATFMFYINDVKYGGATIYPKLNVKVEPVKGLAVLWYNLRRNGNVEPLSMHAGCPVLYGSKWLVTKWIRANAQMWARPCALNPTL